MSGDSTIVHLLSFFAFIVVIYWNLRLRKRWRVLQSYFVNSPRRAIRIAYPLHILASFAEALSIPFEGSRSLRTARLCRVDLQPFFAFHLRAGILSIRYTFTKGSLRVVLITSREISDMVKKEEEFSTILDSEVSIRVA